MWRERSADERTPTYARRMSAPAVRRLAASLEAVIGSVFFSPECHDAYASLGFGASPGVGDGVALPDGPAYVASRAASMGRVSGQVAAAAFGVFHPEFIAGACDAAWDVADPATLATARAQGAAAQLERILGPAGATVDEVADQLTAAAADVSIGGRPLAAGVRSLGPQGDGWLRLFWIGDFVREFRGDSHNAAWATAGLDGAQISLLSDPYRGLPLRSYSATRGWGRIELDAAHAALSTRGWLDEAGLTAAGADAREAIEGATDLQCQPIIDALDGDAESVIAQLSAWSAAVIDAGGYPARSPLSAPA